MANNVGLRISSSFLYLLWSCLSTPSSPSITPRRMIDSPLIPVSTRFQEGLSVRFGTWTIRWLDLLFLQCSFPYHCLLYFYVTGCSGLNIGHGIWFSSHQRFTMQTLKKGCHDHPLVRFDHSNDHPIEPRKVLFQWFPWLLVNVIKISCGG